MGLNLNSLTDLLIGKMLKPICGSFKTKNTRILIISSKKNKWSVDMKDCFSKPKNRSIEEILTRADWIEEMLIVNTPTFDYDWDLVLLADEVKRLRSMLGIK